jgi:phage shock protein A
MGLFGKLLKLGQAKAGELEEKIDDKNRIAFAKQDIEEAEAQLRKARVGLAQTKASIMGLKRQIGQKEEEIEDRKKKVSLLKKADKLDLAKKQFLAMKEIVDSKGILDNSLAQYEATYTKQESNVNALCDNLSSMKRSIERMATMEEVKNSNNALAEINTDSSQSAVARFKEREIKMQKDLDASTALMEGSNDATGDLDAETDAILGESAKMDGFDDL